MSGGAELSEKLPDEILQLVESFKKFVNEQKAYRDQKFHVDNILEVGREVDELMLALQRVAVESDRNAKLIQQIRDETTKLLHLSNTSSPQYFHELADQFEAKMKAYGEQIKELKLSLDSITRTYNLDELFKWLKKQHETLGEIAAKIYMTHERIMEKKVELDKQINHLQQNTLRTNMNTSTNNTNPAQG